MMSNHPRWRVHAQLDDVPWFREISTCKVYIDGYGYEPVWLNPKTAAKLGIADGDLVEIFNDRGSVLGGALLTERVMPEVVYQDHGARLDPLKAGESDRGGANNLICPSNTTSKNCEGEVTNGFLVDIRKADLTALKAEHADAFARDYDPETGILVDGWMEKR